ncbi:hypothetical protein [Actinomadura sp. 3N407]|uniref:hypothetical protein n=1 Tax=Actinomadura sp. 3N407 TaxID=3457423 RepID=UPI003FCE6016
MRWRHDTWVKRGGLALAVVVLFSGGYLWFWLRSAEHRVSQICGGMLPVDDTVGMIFGVDDLKLENKKLNITSTEVPELSWRCKANNIWVTIEPATGTEDTLGPSSFSSSNHEHLPVPLGSGWTGFVLRDDGSDKGAVLLDCRNWAGDKGEGLFITVRDSYGADTRLENRADLARVLTGTARRAAEKTGCDAEPGSTIDRIAPLPPEAPRRLSEATGTCQGMTSQPSARGTAAGGSPAEYCVLGPEVPQGGGPEQGLVLTAMYGPYAVPIPGFLKEPAGIRGDSMWASATCKDVLGTARYLASPQDERRLFTSEENSSALEPLTDAELADFARFAEASAARHGCEAPVLPPAADA